MAGWLNGSSANFLSEFKLYDKPRFDVYKALVYAKALDIK